MHNTNASYAILFESIANRSTIITTANIKISSKLWEGKKNNKETSFGSQNIRKNGNISIEIGINLKREKSDRREEKRMVVRHWAWGGQNLCLGWGGRRVCLREGGENSLNLERMNFKNWGHAAEPQRVPPAPSAQNKNSNKKTTSITNYCTQHVQHVR